MGWGLRKHWKTRQTSNGATLYTTSMLTPFNKHVWYLFLFLLPTWQCRMKTPNRIPQKNCMRLFIFTIEHGRLEGFQRADINCLQRADINCLHIETDPNLPSHIQILKDIDPQRRLGKILQFFVCLNVSHIYRGLSISTHCLEMFGVKSFFVPIISLGRCIKVTQFNKIKSWLRWLPQWCVFFLGDLFWRLPFSEGKGLDALMVCGRKELPAYMTLYFKNITLHIHSIT